MLVEMLVHRPQVLGQVLSHTPTWVGGLLVALTWLGLSQARTRRAGLARVMFMPVAMTALSVWGSISAFGHSPLFGYVMQAWMLLAAVSLALIAPMDAPRGTSYDASSHTFTLPGSWVPMALILATFLTKYVVGVDLTMQPSLARDGHYTLVVGALYGLSSGIFAGRAARVGRLAFWPSQSGTPAINT